MAAPISGEYARPLEALGMILTGSVENSKGQCERLVATTLQETENLLEAAQQEKFEFVNGFLFIDDQDINARRKAEMIRTAARYLCFDDGGKGLLANVADMLHLAPQLYSVRVLLLAAFICNSALPTGPGDFLGAPCNALDLCSREVTAKELGSLLVLQEQLRVLVPPKQQVGANQAGLEKPISASQAALRMFGFCVWRCRDIAENPALRREQPSSEGSLALQRAALAANKLIKIARARYEKKHEENFIGYAERIEILAHEFSRPIGGTAPITRAQTHAWVSDSDVTRGFIPATLSSNKESAARGSGEEMDVAATTSSARESGEPSVGLTQRFSKVSLSGIDKGAACGAGDRMDQSG